MDNHAKPQNPVQVGYPVRRFLIFNWPTYYPGGGFSDFEGSADTLDDAQARVARMSEVDNVEIVDTETGFTWALARTWPPGRDQFQDTWLQDRIHEARLG